MAGESKNATVSNGKVEENKKKSDSPNLEFGGPIGNVFLILWSHYILLYFWYCLESANGSMVLPLSVADLLHHLSNFKTLFLAKCVPSTYTWGAYFSFFLVQLILAAYMPGLTMFGVEIEPGKRLPYHCNGYLSYYFCIFGTIFAYFTGIFRLTSLVDNFGEYLVAAIVIADVSTVFWYFYGIFDLSPYKSSPRTGIVICDFFMGTSLYPRVTFMPGGYEVDIKMIAEARWSWLTLMLLTMACAVKQIENTGGISKEMGLMLLAHWLYSNATVKGEHFIPTTWDMFHEKFGFMLNFWNIAGVPFLYCFQSFYVLKNQEYLSRTLSVPFMIFVYCLLLVAYYCFDTGNSQKAFEKIPIERSTFPQMPWRRLPSPARYIETPVGNLLVDGWYAHVRKVQYTGDIVMALCWALSCGFRSPLPYFYCFFFTSMITHRQTRDEKRCAEKYGEYWKIYTKEVPNVFLPGPSFFKWLLTGMKQLPPVKIPPELEERTRAAKAAKAKSAAESNGKKRD